MTILVTGGAGFIGSNLVLQLMQTGQHRVVNLDRLTYAGHLENLSDIKANPDHHFVRGDVCDGELLQELFTRHSPSAVIHLAAESHVDRSIHAPEDFIQSNIIGTFRLLEAARAYWSALDAAGKDSFRFLHVSTDEVYGSLGASDPAFSETTAYAPNSPYSASKAAADHLVRSYFHTYALPVITTNCSNNYGPYQLPEKLIPLMIVNAISGVALPVYGDGQNVRDWLYVADHCGALRRVLEAGRPGETYNIGGNCERTNLEVANTLCRILDELHPSSPVTPHDKLITFVQDRPGHDQRYAIDATKTEAELGWRASESFESGLRKTAEWYLGNGAWIETVTNEDHRQWMQKNYQARETGS